MSRTGDALAADAARPWRGRILLALGVLAAVLVLALVVPGQDDDDPLDPEGTGPAGAKGLVLLLRELGAEVRVSALAPSADQQVVLLAEDTLDEQRTEDTEAWVEAGGTLVVTDVRSSLNPAPIAPASLGALASGIDAGCPEIEALVGAPQLLPERLVAFQTPGPDSAATACYPTGEGVYLVATPLGRGLVVSIGGSAILTNDRLDEGDDAVLVGALLAPRPGTRVQYLTDYARDLPAGAGGSGGGSPYPPRTSIVVVQGLVVFALAGLWRARRLGRPVLEDPPVELPPSELVVAVGAIDARARRRGTTTARIADRTRRRLAERLGLAASTPPEVVADVLAARTGADRSAVLRALAGPAPTDDAELVRRTASLAALLDGLDATTARR